MASIGGFVKQYQVHINPDTLNAYKIPIMTVADNIRKGNRDTGAGFWSLPGGNTWSAAGATSRASRT